MCPQSIPLEVLTRKGLTAYDVLLFIHLETRRVNLAGFTPYPDQEWMEQQERNMTMEEWGWLKDCRYLLQQALVPAATFQEHCLDHFRETPSRKAKQGDAAFNSGFDNVRMYSITHVVP